MCSADLRSASCLEPHPPLTSSPPTSPLLPPQAVLGAGGAGLQGAPGPWGGPGPGEVEELGPAAPPPGTNTALPQGAGGPAALGTVSA